MNIRGKIKSKINFLLKKEKIPETKKVYVSKELLTKIPELKKFTVTESKNKLLFKIFRAIGYLAILYIKLKKDKSNKEKSEVYILLIEIVNIIINKLRAEEDG